MNAKNILLVIAVAAVGAVAFYVWQRESSRSLWEEIVGNGRRELIAASDSSPTGILVQPGVQSNFAVPTIQ